MFEQQEDRYRCIEKDDGTKEWYNEKIELHREDGPAIERPDGTREWYKHGFLDRENGPAIEEPDGTKQWYM